jgi:hypothetical protein
MAGLGQLSSETTQAETGVSVIMTQHPDPERVTLNVIQEVVGKPLQIASSQAAGIEVIEARIRAGFLNPDLELGKEVVSQIIGDGIILGENLVQISPNPPVVASDHGVSIR